MDNPALLGLQKTSLRVQAVHALRRAITTGELPPGAHVSEIDMAERLQISRGTLREAMRQLQQEGLLTSGPRGRLSVRDMDEHELIDLFAVRGALEALAARLLTERDDRVDAALAARSSATASTRSSRSVSRRAAADAMTAAAENSLDERIEADLNFHRALCRLSANPTLLHTWESLEGSIRMSIMHSGIERAVRNMDVQRHYDIVTAIEAGDPDEAAAEVRAHMRVAAQTLVS
jgi:DNA-binding GntR family transcriptional regulator